MKVGDVVDVELLPAEPGQSVNLGRVLLIGGGEGDVKVGQPVVAGASVRATVVGQVRGDKAFIFKYKPKVRYRRRQGHRQSYTRLTVEEIVPGD
jgi:large subunit ribosomal protein L21